MTTFQRHRLISPDLKLTAVIIPAKLITDYYAKECAMKHFISLIVLLSVSSVCYAGQERVNKGITLHSFSASDISFEHAHMCSFFTSTDCNIPEKVTSGTPGLHVLFYAPVPQLYTRLYIVSDQAGTIVLLSLPPSDFFPAGFNRAELEAPLSPGDYTFTAIVVGANGTAAVSDQYKFSVR